MADTDVLIDALAGRQDVTPLVRGLLRSRRIVTTAISRIELGVGAANDPERRRVNQLLSAIPVVPLDAEAAAVAAERGATLRAAGEGIPLADLAIAGICLALDASLLTRNRKHFRRVEGLRLEEIPGDAPAQDQR